MNVNAPKRVIPSSLRGDCGGTAADVAIGVAFGVCRAGLDGDGRGGYGDGGACGPADVRGCGVGAWAVLHVRGIWNWRDLRAGYVDLAGIRAGGHGGLPAEPGGVEGWVSQRQSEARYPGLASAKPWPIMPPIERPM